MSTTPCGARSDLPLRHGSFFGLESTLAGAVGSVGKQVNLLWEELEGGALLGDELKLNFVFDVSKCFV